MWSKWKLEQLKIAKLHSSFLATRQSVIRIQQTAMFDPPSPIDTSLIREQQYSADR